MNYLVLSYHHYNYSRSGGFIDLSKALKRSGNEVTFLFAGFPLVRNIFKNDDRISFKYLIRSLFLKKDTEGIIHGIWLSFGLHGQMENPIVRFLNEKLIMNYWVLRNEIRKADVVIFESSFAIFLQQKVHERNSKAMLIYRPSDPIDYWMQSRAWVNAEKLLASKADFVLVKNERDSEYISQFTDKIVLIPNYLPLSVTDCNSDVANFSNYPVLAKSNLVIYVGVMDVDWEIIFKLCDEYEDFNFVVVCPSLVHKSLIGQIQSRPNLTWINGVNREVVPFFIQCCMCFMVPYRHGDFEKYKWGLSAKYLMAMYYSKKIIAFNDNPRFMDFGITVCNDKETVLRSFQRMLTGEVPTYTHELLRGTWFDNVSIIDDLVHCKLNNGDISPFLCN